jgi:predicted RNase H-like HicB family nuclease
MASEERKHYHVEYHELNGCHFNPMAEEIEEEEEEMQEAIRLKFDLFCMSSSIDAINFPSFFHLHVIHDANDSQIGRMFRVDMPRNQHLYGCLSLPLYSFVHDFLLDEICVRGELTQVECKQFLSVCCVSDKAKPHARGIPEP